MASSNYLHERVEHTSGSPPYCSEKYFRERESGGYDEWNVEHGKHVSEEGVISARSSSPGSNTEKKPHERQLQKVVEEQNHDFQLVLS